MSEIEWGVVVALLLLGFAAVLALLWRPRPNPGQAELVGRLAELEVALGGAVARGNADLAARVEQVRGDLRTDLSDRLQNGLESVRGTVDRQLTEGRDEQGRRLAAAVEALEQRFEALRQATDGRLDQLGERQAAALKESRTETGQGLTALLSGLHSRFEQLGETQALAARQARVELSQSLADTTRGLQQRFEALELKTGQNLEAIRVRVDERLQTLGDQVQVKLEKNIQEGFAHFQKVQDHLKAAEEQLRHVGAVGQSINELNSLLKMPHLRGQFGEAQLGRLLADFLPAGAFEEQAVIIPGSRERVDAIVRFPQATLPIDSKFNREQILPLFETNDPGALEEARRQLATAIKVQARDIAEKYIHPEHGTTDLALMFLPSETVYFEVIRDVALCDALHKVKVFPVSPNTLAITLRTMAMSIRQYEFAQNVEKTLEQIRGAQSSFGHFQRKFEDVGKGLDRAQEAFHTASGHLNRFTNRVVRLTGDPATETAPEPPAPASSALAAPTP